MYVLSDDDDDDDDDTFSLDISEKIYVEKNIFFLNIVESFEKSKNTSYVCMSFELILDVRVFFTKSQEKVIDENGLKFKSLENQNQMGGLWIYQFTVQFSSKFQN
jgi:hypothetical protein